MKSRSDHVMRVPLQGCPKSECRLTCFRMQWVHWTNCALCPLLAVSCGDAGIYLFTMTLSSPRMDCPAWEHKNRPRQQAKESRRPEMCWSFWDGCSRYTILAVQLKINRVSSFLCLLHVVGSPVTLIIYLGFCNVQQRPLIPGMKLRAMNTAAVSDNSRLNTGATYVHMSRDSAVGIATGYGLDDWEVGFRVPVGSGIFTSPCRPDRLWGPPNLLYNGYLELFPWGNAAGAWSWPLTSN
jgi:hypothetical protein